jgi:precorrin-2 dehydrogenase/sirohydrochlorin ferrochelatase
VQYYPAYLDLRGHLAVVIGGGEIAERKVTTLLDAGARVTVVSPTLTATLGALAETHEIVHHPRPYRRGDLTGAWLAFAATGDEAVHPEIAAEAAEGRVFLNVVDRPRLCSFIVPAVLTRGPVSVAVSTGGASPALAKRLAAELESAVGPEWGVAAGVLGALRGRLARGDGAARARLLSALADRPLLAALRAGDAARVDALLAEHAGPATTLAALGITLAPPATR